MSLRDNIKKGYEDAQSGKFLAPTTDGLKVRLLKFGEGDDENIVRQVGQHFIEKTAVNCLESNDAFCPICEAVRELYEEGGDEQEELAKKISARKKFYFSAVRVTASLEAQKPQILQVGKQAFDGAMEYLLDPDYEESLLGEVDDGSYLIFGKSGSGLDTEYTVKFAPDKAEINPDLVGVDPFTEVTFKEESELHELVGSEPAKKAPPKTAKKKAPAKTAAKTPSKKGGAFAALRKGK